MTRYGRELDSLEARPARTLARWAAWGTGVVVVCFVVFGIGHFALGWFGKAAEIAGPDNVSEQHRAVIEDYEAMEAAAANACAAEAGTGGATLLEDPAFTYKAQYRRIAVDYNRRQDNLFEAKAVGPSGYPAEAPSLEAAMAAVCPTTNEGGRP